MKKISIRGMLNSRTLKYGGYATLFTVAILAALIIMNLIIQEIPAQLDLTSNKMFSLSEQTKKVISSIDKPVTIYGMFVTGNEPVQLVEVIRQYEQNSKFITYRAVDPETNPGFASKYTKPGQQISNGSLIVESGKISKVVSYIDMLNLRYDQQGNQQIESYRFEQRITNALLYVASGETPTIYRLTGHMENSFNELNLMQQIENENFSVKDLNLAVEPSVPADAQLLAVISPKIDFSEAEAEKIRKYLDNAGNAMFLLDFSAGVTFTNLNSLLQTYGIRYNNKAIAMEGDSSRYYASQYGVSPLWIIPQLASHEITNPLSAEDLIMLVPQSAPLEITELKRRTIEVTPVLTTSGKSWIRNDLQNNSFDKISSDQTGPVIIAAAVTERQTAADQKTLRIMVTGSSQFISPDLFNMIGRLPGNVDFFMNALSWTADRSETISVRAKSLAIMPLQLSQLQAQIFAGIFVILIPLIVLGAGLVVWLRRRHL